MLSRLKTHLFNSVSTLNGVYFEEGLWAWHESHKEPEMKTTIQIFCAICGSDILI